MNRALTISLCFCIIIVNAACYKAIAETISAETNVEQAKPIINPNQMSIQQIVDLTKQGVDDNVIIDKIRLTNSTFILSEKDISYLQEQGVNQKVIDEMQGKT